MLRVLVTVSVLYAWLGRQRWPLEEHLQRGTVARHYLDIPAASLPQRPAPHCLAAPVAYNSSVQGVYYIV